MRKHSAGWETSYLVTARPTPAATTGIGPGSAATQAEIPGAAHMWVEVVEVDGMEVGDGMEVTTTTTTTRLAPVPLTMGGGREVRRMLPGPLIMEVVAMEEEDGIMEAMDGTMEVEDGTMGGTGTLEGLDQDITLAITMEVME